MEPAQQPIQRRSRIRRHSLARTIVISPRDIAIFRLLDRYRYLPSNFIHAFVGGNSIRFKQRLGDLFHEGFLNRPARQWQAMNARYRPAIYELDRRATDCLAELGVRSGPRVGGSNNFAHEVMVCLVMASLELGCRTGPALRFVPWDELLAGAPAATRAAANPFAFPLSIAHGAGRHVFDLKPDGRPFAIEHIRASGQRRGLFFPGLEIDRHTEPLNTFDLERSSILRKILAYREMVATELYKHRLAMPNMLVPIVTVNRAHMENMLRLVLALTNGKGASYLLFKTLPDLASVERTIKPDDSILAEPWLRAGYPPFDLVQQLRAA